MSAQLAQALQQDAEHWKKLGDQAARDGESAAADAYRVCADQLCEALAAHEAAPQQEPAITVTIDEFDLVQDWAESRLPPGTHKLYAEPQQAQAPIDPDGEESRAGFRAFDEAQMARWATPWQVWREAVKWAAQPVQQAQAPGWQDIATAPRQQGVPIMVSWPVHELDDEGMPTGPILRRVTLITEMNGSHWLDPDVCNASGAWFGDEYAYAEQPDLWQPLPPAPQQGSATE